MLSHFSNNSVSTFSLSVFNIGLNLLYFGLSEIARISLSVTLNGLTEFLRPTYIVSRSRLE